MITLYHWDLPQALQDTGGGGTKTWSSTSGTMPVSYARVAYQEFGDRVANTKSYSLSLQITISILVHIL